MSYLLSIYYTLSIFVFSNADDYETYCNSRFSFCIKYPKTFSVAESSANGDGATITSADKKTEIRAYGSLAVEDFDKLEQHFTMASKEIQLSYQVKKNNWFVFSGTDKAGEIVYQKTIKKAINYFGEPNTYVFQTLRIKYPPSQKNLYSLYCKQIAKSL